MHHLLQIATSDSVLQDICSHAEQTATNTTLGNYDWSTLGIAIAALVTSFIAMMYTIFTYKAQQRTEMHSAQTQGNTQRISLQAQKGLLEDLVRHLYRNLVVTYAIKSKMRHYGYNNVFPSEEHLIKMKVPVHKNYHNQYYTRLLNFFQIATVPATNNF